LRKIFLTFDTEDFISKNSVFSLKRIIESLKKHDLTALFFITGHVGELLGDFPSIVDLLAEFEIGYHSSSHSVHPIVIEYTDIEDYKEAYHVSLERETSHINPLTGKIEGRGGIHVLHELFPSKRIEAYRAPTNCWSPPHLEALRDLGIKFDCSANISSVPVHFKGITFYPRQILGNWHGNWSDYKLFFLSILKNKTTITGFHPSLFVNKNEWDTIYFKGNPKMLLPPTPRTPEEIEHLFHTFDLFLARVKLLQRLGLIEVTSRLTKAERTLVIDEKLADRCYEQSVKGARKWFNYEPRVLRNHFYKFFSSSSTLH
jgi:peptidoglycan/xylan/chitin deacetylase (PgdA/CDA1 family)